MKFFVSDDQVTRFGIEKHLLQARGEPLRAIIISHEVDWRTLFSKGTIDPDKLDVLGDEIKTAFVDAVTNLSKHGRANVSISGYTPDGQIQVTLETGRPEPKQI